ncbi:hypothetical protein [Actinopolymorpha singaporensis]|uniref:Uncharacterized protein n=1 Tax=Actinopolymorpha singaporensis TaxID=117157 RepID=A0A1H1QQM7_9ACTN|nr:hypothetical protein [Actinopolymorpha singaporensis]SDS25770.1 hypothetical protein SAMN04489717_2111 [Actinopolymorpha singaporensis]
MTDEPRRDSQDKSRWAKEGATPGEDPRDIDEEQINPEYVRRLQERRQVTHAQPEAEDEMGTSSTTDDPTERT